MEIMNLNDDAVEYLDLFEGIDLERNNYHFIFLYENCHKKFNLDEVLRITFYADYLIIVNTEDDRFLFYYRNMDYIKLINMGSRGIKV